MYDIVQSLARPGRDPREDLPPPIFKKGILKLEDLQSGMELKGTVLNVVDFGAFVDIGLKDSGLVHISQMANRYIKSPYDVVAVSDVVTVWVLNVDKDRHRVSLTMIQPGTERKPPEKPPPPRDQQRSRQPRDRQPQPAGAGPGGPPQQGQGQDQGGQQRREAIETVVRSMVEALAVVGEVRRSMPRFRVGKDRKPQKAPPPPPPPPRDLAGNCPNRSCRREPWKARPRGAPSAS